MAIEHSVRVKESTINHAAKTRYSSEMHFNSACVCFNACSLIHV